MFEYLEHTADIKVRVRSRNEFEFYSDLVKSVNSTIFDFKPEKYSIKKEFILESNSFEVLIHDFIDELVYKANQEHFVSKLESINLEKKKDKYVLICSLKLCKANKNDYKTEVKAVSFNVLYKENKKTNEKICEFILDI